ncbi:hypothetical protein N0V83_001394 [Neocucurbitaria cava]|uniref:Uncharacterized protein n=1 Tax=Neocucurbitaria cava TaxID=798079 RepID=A0A9W8YI97_9PLEO|nr:hypothetical protein N0V83_001394 [Neocucurbitaria cava]
MGSGTYTYQNTITDEYDAEKREGIKWTRKTSIICEGSGNADDKDGEDRDWQIQELCRGDIRES